MADLKLAYGTETAFTITFASLASSATAGREATKIDNSSALLLDALVQVQVKLGAGTPGNDKAVYVYAWGSNDTDLYPEGITGSDAALTMQDPTNLVPLAIIAAPTASTTYRCSAKSVAALFGGVLPKYWGIVVRNYSGIALSATEADSKATYLPVYATAA